MSSVGAAALHTGKPDESDSGSFFASTHPGYVRHIAKPLFG